MNDPSAVGVGFGTAALGGGCYDVVTLALEAGFRKFDTAEADWWYDQKAVCRALQDYFSFEDTCTSEECANPCQELRISTKIPPWSLVSEGHIRSNAASSRQELLGFCTANDMVVEMDGSEVSAPFPLDVYYIHAPTCWTGWHPRCDNHPPLLDLRSSWRAMEAVVGLDHNAQRIGLSNIRPDELLEIIQFVREREQQPMPPGTAPPRKPDVVQAYADPIKPADQLRKICLENGIEFVSYSTLGTQHRGVSENPVLGSPVVQSIAQKHGRSTAEVVLSWALQRGMSVIPRSSNRRHIQELARLLEANSTFLDESDLGQIDSMKNTI